MRRPAMNLENVCIKLSIDNIVLKAEKRVLSKFGSGSIPI